MDFEAEARPGWTSWPTAATARAGIEMLHSLFSEMGFHGNRVDYYDPRNSFLNEVMRRRTGIPISLCGSRHRHRRAHWLRVRGHRIARSLHDQGSR